MEYVPTLGGKNVKQLLDNLGISFLWNNINVTKLQVSTVIQRIKDSYLQTWFSVVRNSSKLETYRLLKINFGMEKYLVKLDNFKLRKSMSRFRCSAHKLAIEIGRHRNIDQKNRVCIFCSSSQVENEYHFMLICPAYTELRNKLIPRYYRTWPTITKFTLLLQSDNAKILLNLSKFLCQAAEKREELSSLQNN